MANRVLTRHLLHNVTTASSGGTNRFDFAPSTFQATVTGTGAVSATVVVEVSNDESNWLALATITLSGTDSSSDGFAQDRVPWSVIRGRIAAISGTSAKVNLIQGWSNVSLG